MRYLMLFALICAQARADCALPGARPVADPVLAYRDFGNRCEGLYESKISDIDRLELVSFTNGSLPDNLRATSLLDLSVAAAETAVVRAVPLRRAAYYRMQAKLRPGRHLRWPTSDVLARTSLTGRYLGVLAELQRNGRAVYVPIRINGVVAQPAAIFRSNNPLQALRWRVKDFQDGRCGIPGPWQSPAGIDDGGRIIRILLPARRGTFCIEVTGTDDDQPVSTTAQVSV
jgi:hypothetical protein